MSACTHIPTPSFTPVRGKIKPTTHVIRWWMLAFVFAVLCVPISLYCKRREKLGEWKAELLSCGRRYYFKKCSAWEIKMQQDPPTPTPNTHIHTHLTPPTFTLPTPPLRCPPLPPALPLHKHKQSANEEPACSRSPLRALPVPASSN